MSFRIINRWQAQGGTQLWVNAGAGIFNVPGLTCTVTLSDPANSVNIYWVMPLQTEGAGYAGIAYLRRGGVNLGVGQPIWSNEGILMVPVSETVDDFPGIIGPLSYTIGIQAIVGSIHAPANFGGAGKIIVNEIREI